MSILARISLSACLLFMGSTVQAVAKAPDTPASIVRAILAVPDDKLDYAEAKITFDEIADPSINRRMVKAELDELTREATRLAGPDPTYKTKLTAIRKVIYESGTWNGNRPFIYDPDDPLGRNYHHRLLANYFETRRGTCVSMPILFLILADRLGLTNAALALSPLHAFIRFSDPTGRTFNIETTNGAHLERDEWIRQLTPMTDRAVESGIYMRPLSRREAIANMATDVADRLLDEGRNEDAIAVEEVVLKNFPLDAYAMVKEGTAYARMMDVEFVKKYPNPSLIPRNLHARYQMMADKNKALFDAADALGWSAQD